MKGSDTRNDSRTTQGTNWDCPMQSRTWHQSYRRSPSVVLIVGVLQDEDRSQANKPLSQTNAGFWSSVPSRLSENWWALSSETGW